MRRRDILAGLLASTTASAVRAQQSSTKMQATNSSASGTGTVSNTGWVDGLAGAPTGTPQFPNLFNNYPLGHGSRDKNVVNQPPFNVPGVDYRVGIQTGATLVTPNSGNMPLGATFSGGNITVAAIPTSVLIQNFDMGNGQILITATSGTITIENCRWNLTVSQAPIHFDHSNCTGIVQYCEIYANNNNLPDGFVSWLLPSGGTYTVQYCYFEKCNADGFDWRGSTGGSCIIQYNCLYDTGSGIRSGAHPDFIQIQNSGPQKIWNNLGYNPNFGSQGWGSWDPTYPSITSQNVSITPGGNAYSINVSDPSFTTTNKFIFQNNYVSNNNIGAELYPGYDKTKSVVSGNIKLKTGKTFS
jgi:hypothetical protein